MEQDLRIALEKRIAEHFVGILRLKHADMAALLRFRIAYAAATAVVARAEEAGTLVELEYRLHVVEAGDFVI